MGKQDQWSVHSFDYEDSHYRIREEQLGRTFKVANVPVSRSTSPVARTANLLEGRKRANLIAAAPDLLEACREALTSSSGHGDGPMSRETRERIIQAIAKAEGR